MLARGCLGLSGKERGGGGLVLFLIISDDPGLNLDGQSLELPLSFTPVLGSQSRPCTGTGKLGTKAILYLVWVIKDGLSRN